MLRIARGGGEGWISPWGVEEMREGFECLEGWKRSLERDASIYEFTLTVNIYITAKTESEVLIIHPHQTA
jgi:hypothetical protein